MTYRIVLAPSAGRDLNRLPPAVADAVLLFLHGDLAANPRRVGKSLERDLAGYYSARRGTYRVVYSIHDEIVTVTVVRLRHRRDAYRQ